MWVVELVGWGMTLRQLLARLPIRWRWTLHNLVAHPLSEVLYQIGCEGWSNIVHDGTVPEGGETQEGARG